MIYNYNSDLKYARVVADSAGLTLRVKQGEHPRTDGKTIFLPPIDPLWDKDSIEYQQWWYYLLHECFHNRHPEDFVLLREKKIDTQSFLGMIMNIVIDFKIETINRGEYDGRDMLVHKARYRFAADRIYREFGKGNPLDVMRASAEAVWALDAHCRTPWIPEYKSDNISGLLGPEARSRLGKLLSEPGLVDRYSGQKTAEDSYNLAIEILKVLGMDPNDPEVKGNTGEDQKGEGQQGESDQGNQQGDGQQGEGQQGQSQGKGEQGGGKGKNPAQGHGWVEFSKMMDQHSPDQRTGRSLTSLTIKYDKMPHVDWTPMPIEETVYSRNVPPNFLAELKEAVANVSLSKRIRRELQSLMTDRWQGNKKRGKLHSKVLTRAVTADSARVFKQKHRRFTPKNTNAVVLTDFSGSMGGTTFKDTRIFHAAVATHELSRVLQACQVPHGVWGFTTRSRYNNLVYPLKKFEERFESDEYLARALSSMQGMKSNADGDFLLWAVNKLLRRKADRRILFVLSDGQPAARDHQGSNGIPVFTRKVVQHAESLGIEVYAIGIETDTVSKFYKNHVIIKDASQLEGVLLNLLREKLIGGMV